MKRIRIAEEALNDLNEGFCFYEAQQNGLGDYFLKCLRTDIEGLLESRGTHRIIFRDYHGLLSQRFPLGIFYTCEGEEIAIWAIIDLRRDTDWIRQRLNR